VQRDTTSAFLAPVSAAVAANVTSYTDTNAARGTTYYIRVRAVNLGGPSAWSNVVIVTTP
jgi:hypothetical protein